MAISKQPVTLTKPDANTLQIAIGNETMTLPIAELHAIWDGRRDVIMLLFQFHLALAAAGVNPKTATAAQVKAAIEAQTFWWGN